MIRLKGGITAPLGFKQAAVHSGIKAKRLDLALIVSDKKAVASGLFTSNSLKAAPVILSRRYLRKALFHRAVIINSGNANCLTGREGLDAARFITKRVASLIGCKAEEVFICSTGIIGKRLPVKKIDNALPSLVAGLSEDDSGKAAQAIMTTDTFTKELAFSFRAGKKTVKIAGIAKGAGMIAPNLATMLCIITTDAKIRKPLLTKVLKEAVDSSFNMITVDGAMSTNDTVLVLANGLSGVDVSANRQAHKKFVSVLSLLCLELAKMIVRDGEGATKFVEIEVKNAKTKSQAKQASTAVANSPLFKSMCYGEDPNFGRVIAACGSVLKDINPASVDIYLNDRIAVKSGVAVRKPLQKNLFKKRDIKVLVNLNMGKEKAKVFTCDLTPEYVKINAEYN